MVNEQEGGHLANEGQQLGAEVVPEGTEFPYVGGVIRWPLTNDLPYAYIEYPQDVDLSYAMQRTSNVIAAMRKVRDANTLPQTPQTPPQAATPPQQGNAVGQPIQGQSESNKYECPTHPGVMLLKSAARFDDTGDKFYHVLPVEEHYQMENGMIVKNHTVWRSQLPVGGA